MSEDRLPNLNEVWQKTLKWQPNPKQQQQFQSLYAEILAGNQRLNLTRITAVEDFWEKHLWDSLAGIIYGDIANLLAQNKSLRAIDIGTGAGFPGIPVGIFSEAIAVTLLDSTRKKINFLAEVIPRLQLSNIEALAGRAEAIAKDTERGGTYDLALVRAVGKAELAAAYALPFLKPGGMAILYRGRWQAEDSLSLENKLTQLGAKLDRIATFTTPLTNSTRNCLYICNSPRL